MFTYEERNDPARVVASLDGEWVATFTSGCYTVTLAGPERTFRERFRRDGHDVVVEVTHSIWVRSAPGPVDDRVDERWLRLARDANFFAHERPDALAIAMQYVKGAPPVLEGDLQVAGDASYGPLGPDGRRKEGADFNDYLGLRWLYPTEPADRPESSQHRCLDCSGFMRMVWGYRHHLPGAGYPDSVPLSLRPRERSTLPRRAVEMYDDAPGLVLVPDTGTQVTPAGALDVGDLVFFDADASDGDALDHVGLYLGLDSNGHHRFVSSRKTADGPTMGDLGGPSILDGHDLYARTFRAVRRL